MSAAVDDDLYAAAQKASERAYVPFSDFPVGAAVRVPDGTVFTGANVDNASYPSTVCAEVAAVTAAVSAGHARLTGIAVHGKAHSISPCGGCRQVLAEHADADTPVTFIWEGQLAAISVAGLLPYPFALRPPEEPA